MHRLLAVLAAAAAMGVASEATAQSRERLFVSINGTAHVTKNPFSHGFEFDVNRETGSTDTEYPVEGGTAFDGSVAVGLWKGLGAGVAVSTFSGDTVASTSSRLPHPFFFDVLRDVAGDVTVSRSERGIHVQAVYRVAIASAVQVAVSAGPSFVRVEQDVVTSIEYDEAFPYDTATFRRARTGPADGSGVGFNAGADAAWMLTRHIGVGALVRFARATIDLELPDGRSTAIDAGGFSAGGGLRVAF